LNEKLLDLSFISGYRKLGQNAIFIKRVYEGLSLRADGSAIYGFYCGKHLICGDLQPIASILFDSK
jgi:hypothetical protein